MQQQNVMETPTNGLNYHGVHFVRAELQLVTRETVGQTEGHGVHFRLRETFYISGVKF